MMQRALELLRGSFWRIDLSRVKLSRLEVEFLKAFFDVTVDRMVDDLTAEERSYLVLKKKAKYLSNPYVN